MIEEDLMIEACLNIQNIVQYTVISICCTTAICMYVPGFYIALQCVDTPRSASQAVHSASEWSV